MDPRTVHDRVEDPQVLDVRENDEWAAGRIGLSHPARAAGSPRR